VGGGGQIEDETANLAMANGFERYTKKTRRAVFLEEMEQVVQHELGERLWSG
jgi:hypothetical protein